MTLMHKGYPAYSDYDGTMQDIVIVGYDHKKYFHIREPLADGTRSIPCDKCYTHKELKIPVSKGLMYHVFSRATPKKKPIDPNEEKEET